MLCDLSFKRKTELVAHMKAMHPKSKVSTAEVGPGDESYFGDDSPKKRGRKKLNQDEFCSMFSDDRYGKTKASKRDLNESFESVIGKKKRGRPRKVSFDNPELDKDAHRRCPDCKKVLFRATQVPIHQRAWHVEHLCQFCYG